MAGCGKNKGKMAAVKAYGKDKPNPKAPVQLAKKVKGK